MQKNRLIMCLLSTTLLFNTFNINTKINPFQIAGQPIEKVDLDNINGMVKDDIHRDRLRIQNGQDTRIEELYKERLEMERRKAEELRLEAIEKQRQEEEDSHKRMFIVSYYGATKNECGNEHFVTSSGVPVQDGHIAVPKEIPFGSKVIIDGVEYLATDRGNPKYICILNNGDIRVDVFVPRLNSEINHDDLYEKRIAKMGVKKVVGELFIKE